MLVFLVVFSYASAQSCSQAFRTLGSCSVNFQPKIAKAWGHFFHLWGSGWPSETAPEDPILRQGQPAQSLSCLCGRAAGFARGSLACLAGPCQKCQRSGRGDASRARLGRPLAPCIRGPGNLWARWGVDIALRPMCYSCSQVCLHDSNACLVLSCRNSLACDPCQVS